MALARGTVFAGDFQILDDKPLSEGGMGAVYAVEQLSTGKRRALKLMHAPLVADKKLRERFIQEARVGGRIESAHVVDVVSAGIDDATGMPWLAMELLDGADLGNRIEQRGPLDHADALEIFEQLCHAIGSAHAAGIVHRDLKPENIFLARSKEVGSRSVVKVLDFGIAKVVAEAATKRTGGMGTPLWMAPEQTETGVVTGTADIWALGLIAFYVLTGRCFWKTGNMEEVSVQQIMREVLFAPLPLASVRAVEVGRVGKLPDGFDGWFARCVDRDPVVRFANATLAFDAIAPMLRASAARTSEPPSTEPSGVMLEESSAAQGPMTKAPPTPRLITPTAAMVAPQRPFRPEETDRTVLAPPVNASPPVPALAHAPHPPHPPTGYLPTPPPQLTSGANAPTPPPNVMPVRPPARSSLVYLLFVLAVLLVVGVAVFFFRGREMETRARVVASNDASEPPLTPPPVASITALPPRELDLPRVEAQRMAPVVPASTACLVTIFADPPARVLLDGKAVGFTPLKREVTPGLHVVTLVVLEASAKKDVAFKLSPGQSTIIRDGKVQGLGAVP